MVRLISQFINWLVNTVWFAIQLASPWIVRMFIGTLWLILITLASFWVGIPNAVNQIADDWLDRAVRAGFPTLWDTRLRRIFVIVGYGTIAAGWIFLSFTTVFIVNWLL